MSLWSFKCLLFFFGRVCDAAMKYMILPFASLSGHCLIKFIARVGLDIGFTGV